MTTACPAFVGRRLATEIFVLSFVLLVGFALVSTVRAAEEPASHVGTERSIVSGGSLVSGSPVVSRSC